MITAQVSVVIPTRNRVELVLRAVQCALDQRGVDTEIVVVDDGSTDGTSDAVHHRFGGRVVTVRRDTAGGVSNARNEGIERSSSGLVAFLDDDDVWAPDKLVCQLDALDRSGRVWSYAGMVTVNEELRILHGVRPDPPEVIARDILLRNRLPSGPSNVLVQRDALRRAGGFDPGLRYHEDWDLWIRLNRIGPPSSVERPLLAHVQHGGNTPVDAIVRDLETIDRRYAAARGGRPIDRGAVYRWIAGARLAEGDRWSALRAYARAMVESPGESGRFALLAMSSRDIGPRTAYRRPPDPDWFEQAELWLRPLRATESELT
jgi:glycosyltransferase involved in cell wall biosynthesis